MAVKDAKIGSITWSDHASITLIYALSDTQTLQRHPWRLNESLLQDPEILADVVKEIGHYFDTNSTQDSKPEVVWETHKAVIQGILIKHGSRQKRLRTEQLKALFITKLLYRPWRHSTSRHQQDN